MPVRGEKNIRPLLARSVVSFCRPLAFPQRLGNTPGPISSSAACWSLFGGGSSASQCRPSICLKASRGRCWAEAGLVWPWEICFPVKPKRNGLKCAEVEKKVEVYGNHPWVGRLSRIFHVIEMLVLLGMVQVSILSSSNRCNKHTPWMFFLGIGLAFLHAVQLQFPLLLDMGVSKTGVYSCQVMAIK